MAFRLLFAVVLFGVALSAHAQEDGGTSSGGLVIEDWSEPASTSSPDAGTLEIEEDQPEPNLVQPEPVEGLPSFLDAHARVYGSVRAQTGVDTAFDSPRGDPLAENVFDGQARVLLGADIKLSDAMRLVVEGRGWWRVTGQRAFDRTKATWELEPGEAFLDVYTKSVDLRFGNQVVPFGANAAFAPSDQLNPRDLRGSFLLAEPGDLKLPNLGARAIGTVGKVTWTAAYFPFFQPNRYAVVGQDEAMVQPGLGAQLPQQVDASIEDQLQPHLLETKRPKAFPWLGDLGLRATTQAGPVRLGVSWVWVNEKTPMVTLDPELAALARSAARGNDPDPAIALSVQDRLASGEQLMTGFYPRQHVFSGEAQALIGSAQLDVDLAYSPAQTLYGSDLKPLRKETITWVVGLSQAEDSPLLYNLTWTGIAVPDLPSDGYLFLLEPATAAGAPRTVFFHSLFGTVGYALFDRRLEVSVRGAFEPVQRSFALAPRIAWKGWDRTTVALGAELYQGKVYSPFGYFDRNDQVLAQLQYDFF